MMSRLESTRTMDVTKQFSKEVQERIEANGRNEILKTVSQAFVQATVVPKYSYNFSWFGRPIIQYPQDMMAMQEIIWEVKPALIIVPVIAHGGSLIFSVSMLGLNAACGGPGDAEVLGIDINIRPHNREAIEAHPISKRIAMIEGSSIAPEVVAQVKKKAEGKNRILICMDSNHTHDHVLAELEAYAPEILFSGEVPFQVFVTSHHPYIISNIRPWHPGNS